ncbi:MAG: FAD-dependent oxidoreductase [Myxococcota bacterium]
MFLGQHDELSSVSTAGVPRRYDFGEVFFGKSGDIASKILEAAGKLRDAEATSLAKQVREHIFNAQDRAEFVSNALEYLRSKKPDLNQSYDIVVVGAGLHAAAFLYTLKKNHPKLKVLIVEKTSTVCSTFSALGDSLVLNSPTFSKVGLNSNILPGQFIQVSDFDELAERPFPTAKHLFELATLALFHSDADIRFDFSVVDVVSTTHSVQVKSAESAISARSAVIANGMGDPRTRAFAKDSSENVIEGDAFIAAVRRDEKQAEAIAGKRVAVVGSGDTANCVMECLLPLTYPHRKYGYPEEAPLLPRSLHWIGQGAADVRHYYFANKRRYCHAGGLIEFFWHGESSFELSTERWRTALSALKCVPEKLTSLTHSEHVLLLETETQKIEADVVIDCSGRENRLSAALLQTDYEFLTGAITFYGGQHDEMLDRFVVEPRVFENRKIACRSTNAPVYFVGSACPLGELIEDTEARDGSLAFDDARTSLTNSKWSLEHTLPRTVAFAENFPLLANMTGPDTRQ